APPRPLADALAGPPPEVPARVRAAVEFLPTPVLLLDNQQREGRVGVRAYAQATTTGSTPVLVELGWLPMGANRALPQVTVPSGTQIIDGVLLPWPGQGLRLAENPWEGQGAVLLTYLDR
ncbi:SURF1 family protein, partial [Xanthomonadaceae bacterium JHOS43]|nr:SURF1 family protein [Xanthomonadaceae bacterium JHOS43]